MALQSNKQSGNTTTAQAQAPLGQTDVLGAAAHSQPQGQPSGGTLFGRTQAFIGTARNNQQLTQTVKAVQDWLNDVDSKKLMRVMSIDASMMDLGIGVVTLTYPFQSSQNKKFLVTFMLLIESTAPSIGMTREWSYNDPAMYNQRRSVHLPITAGTLVDDVFCRKVASMVTMKAEAGFSYLNAGMAVIPKEVDLEKDVNLVAQVAQMGTEAISTIITLATGDKVREIATAVTMTNGKDLNLQLDFEPQPLMSMTRQPIRNELAITLSGRDKMPPQMQTDPWYTPNQDQYSNVRPYVTTNGFLDLAYYALTDGERMGMGMNQMGLSQRWQASYVITNVTSHDETWSIDTLLLSLYTSLHLADQNNWMLAFSPRHASVNQLRDIGMLPLDLDERAGPQPPVDTRSPSFDDMTFARYMSVMMRPGLGISIDVEKAGPMSWIGAIVAGAAVVGSPSYMAFIASAHAFTDGKFPLTWNEPIIRSDNRTTLLGNVPGPNGSPVDVRVYADYLTQLTKQGQTNMHKVREFDATTVPNNTEQPQLRLAKARDLVEEIVGKSVRYTDVADRYSFSTNFLTAFAAAVAAAGMRIQPSSQQFMSFGAGRRTSGMDTGYVNSATNSFFQFGGGTGGIPGMGGGFGIGQTWTFGQNV